MKCVICGSDTCNKAIFKNSFTAYGNLQCLGGGMCDRCDEKINNSWYRRNSWIELKGGKIIQIDRGNELDSVMNIPLSDKEIKSGFRLYITKKCRKHGWLSIGDRFEYSREFFAIAFEDELIFIDSNKVKEFYEFVKMLKHKYKLSKHEMYSGDLSLKSMKRLRGKYRCVMRYIKRVKGNPMWELVVCLI